MELIRARPRYDTCLRSRVHSVLGRIDRALHLEFLYGFDRKYKLHVAIFGIRRNDPVQRDGLVDVPLPVSRTAISWPAMMRPPCPSAPMRAIPITTPGVSVAKCPKFR